MKCSHFNTSFVVVCRVLVILIIFTILVLLTIRRGVVIFLNRGLTVASLLLRIDQGYIVPDSSKLAKLCFGESDPSIAAAGVSGHTIRTKE
jgi:hypothetical protein